MDTDSAAEHRFGLALPGGTLRRGGNPPARKFGAVSRLSVLVWAHICCCSECAQAAQRKAK
jgi:hypothetical protein